MGVACKIFKNKEGKVEKVEAPNGLDSFLYESALSATGNEDRALEIWATAYTPGFQSYYGMWEYPETGELFDLDSNGEPKLFDVIKYLEKGANIVGTYTKDDVLNINSFIESLGLSDIDSLVNKIQAAFYSNGYLEINRRTLLNSGLYSNEEIDRIMSDGSILDQVTESITNLMSGYSDLVEDDRSDYYFSNDNSGEFIIPKNDSYDSFGKNKVYSPAELDLILQEAVGGITDRAEFNRRMTELGYPEISDRYENDYNFQDSVYNRYSSMVEFRPYYVSESDVREGSKTYFELMDYSHPNLPKLNGIRSMISDVTSLTDEEFNSSDTLDKLNSIEKAATDFGIDLSGLSSGDISHDMADDLLIGLDIYLTGINRGDYSYASTLADTIDNVLDRRKGNAMFLPGYLKGKNLVMVRTNLSDKEMFERYNLLRVGKGLYERVNRSGNYSNIYPSIAELSKKDPSILPASAYPPSMFKDGVLNADKLRRSSGKELEESIRRYVLSQTEHDNTEEMVLFKMLGGMPLREPDPDIDMQRELNRYMNKGMFEPNKASLDKLWGAYLKSKVDNTELYNSVYKYLDFGSNDLDIKSGDRSMLKSIDLNVKGSARSILFGYAMTSVNPNIKDLFFIQNESNYAGEDFYHYIYSRNPRLVKEYKGGYSNREDSSISINGMYDNFTRIGGDVYMKIAEDQNGSIYKSLDGTESEVKYQSTQIFKDVGTDNNHSRKIFVGNLFGKSDIPGLEC